MRSKSKHKMKYDLILGRYAGEVFIKSERVRRIFIRQLVSNLSAALQHGGVEFSILRKRDRIFIKTDKIKKACGILRKIFGLASISPCIHLPTSELKTIQNFCRKNYTRWINPNQTFAVRVSRIGKHPYTSQELSKAIGDVIPRRVDLKNPDKEIFVEVRDNNTYIFLEKIRAGGGLPVGSTGKVISLVSGGIDSPVASWLMMKRGCKVIFAHFHSFPIVSKKSIYKVRELVKVLNSFQIKSKVYFIPFSEIQTYLKARVEPRYLVVLYRRFMLRISEEIARKEKAKALVTGESLAQVSSQTLENLGVIQEASALPILRPLVGMDKEEIIKLAKKIKTYEISIKPQEDCCRLFVPKHASAKTNLQKIKEIEKTLPIKRLVKAALNNAEVEII